MSQPAISKHLKVLERAGLISRGRDAQRRPCRLEAKPLAEANRWLEDYRQFWEGTLRSASTTCSTSSTRKQPHEERNTDEEHRNTEGHDARRSRDRDDPRLRRTTPPGLRRLTQARAAQALVRAARLVAGGLRGRSHGSAARGASSGVARRPHDGDERRLSRDRARRAHACTPRRSTTTRATRVITTVLTEQRRQDDAHRHRAVRIAGGPRRRRRIRHGARRRGDLRQARRPAAVARRSNSHCCS